MNRFVLTARTALLVGALVGGTASAQPAGQLITTVPGTLFNNTLPPALFADICGRAVQTGFAVELSDQQRYRRIVAEGGAVERIYQDDHVLVYLKTPAVDIYSHCFSEGRRLAPLRDPTLVSPIETGSVMLYVMNPGRTRDDLPFTSVRMLFLDQEGGVLKEVPPYGAGELGRPVIENGSVVRWPANYIATFGDWFRKPDMLVPDFAKAATLRIEFTQDDVPHVLDFKVVQSVESK